MRAILGAQLMICSCSGHSVFVTYLGFSVGLLCIFCRSWQRWQAISSNYDRCYRSVVCPLHLFMCSHGKRYRHNFFLLYTTAPCIFQVALKIWLRPTSVNPLLSNICSKVTHARHMLIWASIWDIRSQIAVKWSQWRAYMKPTSLFRMVAFHWYQR